MGHGSTSYEDARESLLLLIEKSSGENRIKAEKTLVELESRMSVFQAKKEERIVSFYNNGKSAKEIASISKYPIEYIINALSRFGFQEIRQ